MLQAPRYLQLPADYIHAELIEELELLKTRHDHLKTHCKAMFEQLKSSNRILKEAESDFAILRKRADSETQQLHQLQRLCQKTAFALHKRVFADSDAREAVGEEEASQSSSNSD